MVLADFFEEWPNPKMLLAAQDVDVKKLLKPLGLQNIRYTRIIKMTHDWLAGKRPPEDKLFGIGVYALQSYEIFCRGYLVLEPQDKELQKYVEWAKQCRDHDGDQA